jgi:hypothetical protein
MILYYALGGGLGHIARSIAVIGQAPAAIQNSIRLLVSSNCAEAARPVCPCPMDTVPEEAMAIRRLYRCFLDRYLNLHGFTCMVLDTFPFGLVGEWSTFAPELPRILVGRYLRWDIYQKSVKPLLSPTWPQVSLMIEDQDVEYMSDMSRHSRLMQCNSLLSLARPDDYAMSVGRRPVWCVVHSGSAQELATLVGISRQLMAEQGVAGTSKILTPDQGGFPLEQNLRGFTDVVSGAGYASCAAAKINDGKVRYHLHAFSRRYDDQELRLSRLRMGRWGENHTPENGKNAGQLLWDEVAGLRKS